ncbi:MAG TPA: PIG-L family deacetylase [Candidatus Saccharimonadales bacterium]|nr:PIG-L family deacetylase [Candidatus Saccharimonadales bacterium]
MQTVADVSPLVLYCRKAWHGFVRVLSRAAKQKGFRQWYVVGALAVLFTTTLLWAVLGARLQQYNADQLSDPYLFTSRTVFHGASFPGAHTFLLKWPIFWLVGLFGANSLSLIVATVGVVLLTVAALVVVIYKIDRRPLVFGTTCLALSLVLLLVPAQPYAGGLLPVNMAMLTTRNLEYVVYLGALILFAQAGRLKNYRFVLGVGLLCLLIASDKLFLGLSAGGALLALLTYALCANWGMATFAARWLLGTAFAWLGAVVVLLGISATHVTKLVNSAATTPFAILHSAKDLALGVAYALSGLFTNVGANPVYDNTVLARLPGQLAHRLWNVSAVTYVVTVVILVGALVLTYRVLWPTLRASPRRSKLPTATTLAVSLLWSTVAAIGVFVFTKHYYAVDARYLAIGFFTVVIMSSVWLRKQQWRWPEDLLLVGCVLVVAIGVAVTTTLRTSATQAAALHGVNERNKLVAAALMHHKVDVLVGDYWRVLPIKQATHGELNVLPLADCTQPSTTLTSSAWHPDLRRHRFAYLITLDSSSLTGFPRCSLGQIAAVYGHPNATQVIAGTLTHPAEALLFYDDGSHPAPPKSLVRATPPLLPIGLDQLAKTDCVQPTVMNVVAHEDDDLLFLSPDLLHELHGGDCVRTVFMTAGDSGFGRFYWLNRQLGSEAAYSTMLGIKNVWEEQTLQLAPNEYITVATPRESDQVSLIFLNLPDGNLQGQGFAASGHASLAKLYGHDIARIHTVDGQSTYTYDQLVQALATLIAVYQPAEVHTQADPVPDTPYPDHSDHITTSKFAELAASQYDTQHFGNTITIPVIHYIGYSIHAFDSNVSGDDLAQKEAAFFAYGQYDRGTCRSMEQCDRTNYAFYLPRQYQE